jgi:hypothetical protein
MIFNKYLIVTFLFFFENCFGAQTYWLKNFAPSDPKNPPAQLRVTPPNPADLRLHPEHVDVTFITIDGDLLIVNDHICHAKLKPFERKTHIKFGQWEEVEEIGGYPKFRANLIKHLKSDPDTWDKVMWMDEIKSAVPDYVGECGLFKGIRRIYFGKDDVIIPDPFHGYYRYVKGDAAVFYRTMEEAEQKRIRAAEESRKLEERILKSLPPAKVK